MSAFSFSINSYRHWQRAGGIDYQEACFTLGGGMHLKKDNWNGAEDARLDRAGHRTIRNALHVNPKDSTAKENLELIRQAMEKPPER